MGSVAALLQGRTADAMPVNQLRGKLNHARSCFEHRGVTGPLVDGDPSHNAVMRSQLRFFLDALSHAQAKVYYMPSWPRERVTAYTDASFAAGAAGSYTTCRLCWIVCPQGKPAFGRVYDVPQSFWDRVTPRLTQIVVAEALAVVLLHRDASDAIRCLAGTLFIDNLPALSGFVLGHSKLLDLCSLYMGTTARCAFLRTAWWFEYVPSDSNLADGGSRVGLRDPIAAAAGVTLSQGVFPTDWPCFDRYEPSEWSSWWSQ